MPNRTNNDHYIIIYSLPSASHLICTVYPRGGGGVLGYKHDRGCPTEPNILHPKKYKTASNESYCVRKNSDDQADDKLV